MKSKKLFSILALAAGMLLLSQQSFAHCEIPCGIYGDSIRLALLKEHITTIEKSMTMINELSAAENPDYNQLVRWVVNKEEHANEMQHIVSQYFLHQRIKPTDPDDSEHYDKYIKELTLLHQVLVYAMKSKQSTDLGVIESLRKSVDAFADSYFGDHHH
jgi:nickel superoxide dismutase